MAVSRPAHSGDVPRSRGLCIWTPKGTRSCPAAVSGLRAAEERRLSWGLFPGAPLAYPGGRGEEAGTGAETSRRCCSFSINCVTVTDGFVPSS